MTNNYSIKEAAKILGVHEDTLRNWEDQGLIKPLRVGKRQDRRYTQDIINKIVDKGLAHPVMNLDKDAPEKEEKMSLEVLKSFLWKSADILRGKIDSGDYKTYIFGLLFYKRISDVWDEEYESILEKFHDEELAHADYNHKFQVPKDCRWSEIQKEAINIGAKFNDVFDKITTANSPKLDKIFNNLNFADKDRFPNETLQRLVNHFSKYNFGNTYINSDILGDAYEYLIKQFASDSGKKGGQFYSPREIERVIMKIIKPDAKSHVHDPTCGSGGFLLEAYHYVREKFSDKEARKMYLSGQEIEIGTFGIAKINMFLHGLESTDIRRGDTLADPQFLDKAGKMQTFSHVVANFPYSIKEWEWDTFVHDKHARTDGYELPPKKNADYAFILHIIKSLNENGKAGIVVPHGVLFKSDTSGRIREQVLKNDLIEAVIAMPSKLFFGVGIPVALLILNKTKPANHKNKILFIDAERDYQEGKNQNSLRNQDIEKIASAFDNWKDINKYARVISAEEIKENDYNLNVRRYIDSSEIEEKIDVSVVWKELKQIEKEKEEINKKVEGYLKELKY